MTDKELQQLAREYGVLMAKDASLPNCLKNEVINTTEETIVPFLQWLSSRYCIVEKEAVKAIYNRKTIPTQEDIQKQFVEECLIEALFGKELFNEPKQ